MRLVRRVLGIHPAACGFALLIALAFAPRAIAQQKPDPRNAATWYQRAIGSWQQFKQNFPQQAQLLTEFAADPSAPITPEIRSALINVQGAISDMRRGSMQETCDFNLDYSQGFELLLPHLSPMRDIARVMRADAAVRIADGDTSGAASELSSLYRASGHCGDDHVLISGLVGQAIFGVADGIVQNGLDKAAFNAADAASLLAGAKQLDASDPFQYAQSVAIEQEIALATFDKYRGPEGRKAMMSMLGEPGGDELAALDDKGFDEAIGQYDTVMSRMGEIFAMPDHDAATKAMGELEKDIESGKCGLLSKVMAPALGKILQRKFLAQQMLADRIAVLSALASGAQKPEEAANAALWYLRAVEMWEALPKEKRQPLLAFEIDAAKDVPAPIAALLVEAQPVLDVMREASLKRRCDFAVFVDHRGPPAVAPHYLPGMHELLRVLRIDALRLLKAGERDGVSDRLGVELRAIAHLSGIGGGTPQLACSRAAHVNFNLTLDLIESAQKLKLLDAHPSADLGEAASRISRKDPFGYLDAMLKTREVFVRQRYAPPPPDEDGMKEWARQTESIKQLNGDQTMLVLITVDERMRRMIANPPPPPQPPPNAPNAPAGAGGFEPDDITLPETIDRLTGVFDAKAVEALRGAAGFDEIMPRLLQDDWQVFLDQRYPAVARLTEGLGRSRGDLRRATRLLMLTDEPENPSPTSKPQ